MASQQAFSRIPAFYRVFFTSIDPLVAFSGIYMNTFMPATVLNSLVPTSIATYNPQLQMLFLQGAGYLLGCMFLSVVLLRYTKDVGVWKLLQTSILLVDLSLLYALWDALGRQNRRSLAGMRPEDWGCLAITGAVALIRSCFLLEVGWAGRARLGGQKRK